MKQRIKYLTAIALAAMLFVPAISGAQKMPKKHKNAPEKTVVVVTNPLVKNFDASEYPQIGRASCRERV